MTRDIHEQDEEPEPATRDTIKAPTPVGWDESRDAAAPTRDEDIVQPWSIRVLGNECINCMNNENMKLWTNECDWVVATDKADAAKCYEENTGECSADYDHEWREDTRSIITVKDEDGPDETHSAAEWVSLNGRGYLWCTEN